MTPEKIIEIARRYDPHEPDFVMTADTLVAFAQSVIEADRECSDEPEAWYDKYGMITHDRFEGVTPLYTRPAPARKPLSEDSIDKAYDDMCHVDSWSDFREGVRWAEKMHDIGEENAL